mmetsp:Transcript_20320/g.43870  ORF Transcript_20320/g.43870 Transcript_20320/m.43870 type:complete len:83 (+) Transcript_20320:1946-2194(+)
MQDTWAYPAESPLQAQLRIKGPPLLSGPSSRQIQHVAPLGAVGGGEVGCSAMTAFMMESEHLSALGTSTAHRGKSDLSVTII